MCAEEELKLQEARCRAKDLEGTLVVRAAALDAREAELGTREQGVASRAEALAAKERTVAELQVRPGSR